MTDLSNIPSALRLQMQRIRRKRLREKQTFYALLGNGSGVVYVPNTTGKVWVRFQSSADSDGNVTYTPAKDVNSGSGGGYFVYDGSPVRVGFDDDGELEVKRSDTKKARNAGLDTGLLNSGNPVRKWFYLRNIGNFKSLAPGSSTVVSVRSLLYDDNYGDLNLFAGTRRLADKIDLAAYIPSTGNHRVACLFLRTTDNTIQVYASTTQSIATDIDLTDYQECFDQRDAESIPIQGYILQNNQSSISMLDSAEDLRQIFNMPQALGFPDPVDKETLLRDGRTQFIAGTLTTTDTLTALGMLTVCGDPTPPTTTINPATFKSYTVTTQGLAANPDVYAAGYLEFSTTDTNLDEGGTTQAFGDANVSHAAHAFVVYGGAGSVNTGVVGLRVSGTSITDAGVRTTSDTETISSDITTTSLNEWAETDKKWLGQVTFELFTVSGAPTVFSLDFNYGLSKYEDFGNRNFTVTDIEAVGLAGANDNTFDIKLFYYNANGWTYAASGFDAITATNTIVSLAGDHSTDDQLVTRDHFAWKRAGLTQGVNGSDSEGIIVRVETSANNAVEYCNIHIGVTF
jgi:hypothetical protein